MKVSGEEIVEATASNHERIVALRRAIHSDPERGLDNPKTRDKIAQELERIGVPVRAGKKACSWLVADIEGTASASDRVVALRADTDALPLTEHTGLDFASKTEGVMHACGHDGHVAMLLGAADALQRNRDRFAGTVRLLFQPGEEGFGGARHMIEEGALDGVDAAFAIHLQPSDPSGTVGFRTGAVLAADDNFRVTFRGAGGHASTPHDAVDPIPAIGPFVDGLSHAAARETDPADRVVFSVTMVRAGTAGNVIPHEAVCRGTLRSLSPGGRERAHEQLRRIADGVAKSRGLEADVALGFGYSPTINDGWAVDHAVAAASSVGLDPVEMPGPYMGAEDFSYMLEKVPGAMVFLGCGVDGGGPLHSDVMMVDETVLPQGAALHVATALRMLGSE